MQRDTERDLISAWQQGNLGAARQLVTALQSEALYVSYLLTGERTAAVALAESGFLDLFEQAKTSEPDFDVHIRLLRLIGHSFLRGDYKQRERDDLPVGLALDSGPARFGVENRRTRLLAALGRLENRERTALVLGDFSGLERDELNAILERRNDTLTAPVETARQRVRQSLDIASGESLRPVLAEATFDAPRIDLWPRLEDTVTDIQRHQRQQSQIITYSIVAIVLVVLLAGIAALFSDQIFSDGDSEGTAGAQGSVESTATAAPSPTLAPPVLVPAATPEQSGTPVANVPDWLLLRTSRVESDAPEVPIGGIERYYPDQNRIRPLSINDIRLVSGTSTIQFSPDGYQMTLFRQEAAGTTTHYIISSFATDSSFGLQWESEVLAVEHEPDAVPTFADNPILVDAITGDRVYAAVLTNDTSPALTVHAFARRNGQPRGTLDIELPVQTIDTRTFQGNIYLYAPPESDQLYLILEAFGDPGKGRNATLFTIARATMEITNRSVIGADPEQEFWFGDAQPTIDGGALYGLEARRGSQARMRFLDLETGERTVIDLPFTIDENVRYSGVALILSHDGHRLYLVDWTSTTVAVIDLVERRMERLFPLDLGDFAGQFSGDIERYLFAYDSILSADGTHIYLAVTDQDSQSGIWEIDTVDWRISNYVQVGGYLDRLHLAPAENAIYVQARVQTESEPRIEMVKMQIADTLQVIDRVAIPSDVFQGFNTLSPANIYRSQYSRSPAIAGVGLTDSDTFSTLPRLEVTTTPDVLAASQQATIEVQVIDPASGDVLTTDRPDVRFDSTAGITAVINSPDGQRQFLVLGQAGPGVYQGGVTVQTQGTWTVDVTLTDANGQTWTSPQAGQIDVVPAYVGSNGRLYLFELSIERVQPALEEDTTVTLRLIDAETREPMPDGVTPVIEDPQATTTLSGLPEQINVNLMKGAEGGLTVTLDRTTNAVYQGTAQFWSLGAWTAEIFIQPEDQPRITIPANTIEVGG